MLLFLQAYLAIWLTTFVSVSMMALAGRWAGVMLEEVGYGHLPVAKFGIFRFGIIPMGGYAKFKNSDHDFPTDDDAPDAMASQPKWMQIIILFSGNAVMLAGAFAILGEAAWPACLSAPRQLIAGAWGPLTTAQQLLGDFGQFLDEEGFLAATGLLFAKIATLNMLPVPLLNGGQALMLLLNVSKYPRLVQALLLPSFVILLLIGGCWIAAVGKFTWVALMSGYGG